MSSPSGFRPAPGLLFWASLAPVVSGLAASAALAVDYAHESPVFCAEGGGCDALRQTAVAAPLGVPLPLFGLAGFALLALAVLTPGRAARLVQTAVASAAAVAGAALLGAQVVYGHFCPYCSVVDASAILAAVAAIARLLRPGPAPAARVLIVQAAAGGALAVGASVGTVALGQYLASRPPAPIAAEIGRTPAGQLTVVDFVDFECPYCRMTHAALEPVLAAHRHEVRLVRRQVPLAIHPHAREAARAACCGERLGKGDAMASALFTTPVEGLTREGCEKVAASVGLDLDPYRACVADPQTDARIDADVATFHAVGGKGLPLVYVDRTVVFGAQPRDVLERVVDAALAKIHG